MIKNVTHTHGILFSHKNGNPAVCDNTDGLEGNMLSKIGQTERQTLYDLTYMWHLKQTKLTETEQVGGCQKQGVGENG